MKGVKLKNRKKKVRKEAIHSETQRRVSGVPATSGVLKREGTWEKGNVVYKVSTGARNKWAGCSSKADGDSGAPFPAVGWNVRNY